MTERSNQTGDNFNRWRLGLPTPIPVPQTGWICPVCRRGVSPTAQYCPCQVCQVYTQPVSEPFRITCYNDSNDF